MNNRTKSAPPQSRPSSDDLEGLKALAHARWATLLASQNERLQRLRDSWTTTVPFTPQSLADVVRADPSVTLADMEHTLLEAGGTPVEALRYGAELGQSQKPGEETEAGLLRWASQMQSSTTLVYWMVRHVLRVAGTELIRTELERFATNLEKHYVLIPRTKVPTDDTKDLPSDP